MWLLRLILRFRQGSDKVARAFEYFTRFQHHPQSVSGPCVSPLGMESGEIDDNLIWASSFLPERNPEFGRIRSTSGNDGEPVKSWAPKEADTKPYLEVSFLELTEITAISTQGGEDGGYVRQYQVEYADKEGVKMVDHETLNEDGEITREPLTFEGIVQCIWIFLLYIYSEN